MSNFKDNAIAKLTFQLALGIMNLYEVTKSSQSQELVNKMKWISNIENR